MLGALYHFSKNINRFKNDGTTWAQIKYFNRWRESLKKDSSSIKDQQPWITFQAIDFLKTHLNKQSKVFEFGGGGSTLFFLNQAKETITVEHDQQWYGTLSSIIAEKKLHGWTGKHIKPEPKPFVEVPDPSNPHHYSSNDKHSLRSNFYYYASAIDEYPVHYFDVVLVDGRSRPSCLLHSIPKLKINGYLILDNSDRHYYLKNLETSIKNNFAVIVDGYCPTPYSLEFTKSTIWKKISE